MEAAAKAADEARLAAEAEAAAKRRKISVPVKRGRRTLAGDLPDEPPPSKKPKPTAGQDDGGAEPMGPQGRVDPNQFDDAADETSCAWYELWPLLRRVGAVEKDAVTLEAPIEKGKVTALLLAIQRARGWPEEAMDTAKAKAKAIKKAGLLNEPHDSKERIKRVLETEAHFPESDQLVFVWQCLGRRAHFEAVTDVNDQEGVRWGYIPVDAFEESFPDKPVCILVFNGTTRELTPWFRPASA